jgi:hypothetical protein
MQEMQASLLIGLTIEKKSWNSFNHLVGTLGFQPVSPN